MLLAGGGGKDWGMIIAQTTHPSAETYAAISNLIFQLSGLIGAITALVALIYSRRADRKADKAGAQTQTVAQATQALAADPATQNLDAHLQSRLDDVANPPPNP